MALVLVPRPECHGQRTQQLQPALGGPTSTCRPPSPHGPGHLSSTLSLDGASPGTSALAIQGHCPQEGSSAESLRLSTLVCPSPRACSGTFPHHH